MMQKPAARTVLIVGATSSIGRLLVDRFRSTDSFVIATHHAPFDDADSQSVIHKTLDLQDDSSISAFSEWIKGHAYSLDVAVFTAGILPGNSLEDYEFQELSQVMDVNFSGQAKALQSLLANFSDGGQVVMLSSISALAGSYDPIYAASKGAILSFVKSLAINLAPRLRVNAVAPGLIQASSMFNDMSAETKKSHINRTPTKQLLHAQDLASIIIDMCQPHWRHLNGECISVNGGRYVR